MPAPARANYPDFLHHLIEHLSLVGDQRVKGIAQRTEQNNYGSEGWGFESLRARYKPLTEKALVEGPFSRMSSAALTWIRR